MFDIIVASLLLVIISPLFAILMAIIKRDKGPAMFAHERIGLNGQTFKCMKFRSMVLNADEMLKELFDNNPSAKTEWEKDHKLKNDPRITAIGHILRKTSLDELPQLLNVLKGEMSLIGPRPVVEEELIRYGDDITYYLMVRPGMTGLWQISGRNDVDYNTRVYMDCWYVKNWALWTDIVIMCKTIPVLFERNNGAY